MEINYRILFLNLNFNKNIKFDNEIKKINLKESVMIDSFNSPRPVSELKYALTLALIPVNNKKDKNCLTLNLNI